MKLKTLTLKNVGIITDATIPINQPLILFYGEIRQGKTTLLNAIRWVCGGEFPQDIIRHGQDEASIELAFENGCINRSFYRSNGKGEVKSRAVSFVRDGKLVPSPVGELKKFLNPFLLDQDHLRNISELERKRFLADLFAVDTTTEDDELAQAEKTASELRAELRGYGAVDLTPVESVDVTLLQSKVAEIKAEVGINRATLETELAELTGKHETECESIDRANESARMHNNAVQQSESRRDGVESEIKTLESRLAKLKKSLTDIKIDEKLEIKARPEAPNTTTLKDAIRNCVPDTAAIDKQIQDAGAQNERARQYATNLNRHRVKIEKEKSLSELEATCRKIRSEKISKLETVSETCGVPGLKFDEDGNFSYHATSAGMLSTSQIMELSSELSSLYPPGLGVEILDRAESLGKSIFSFVERATANKTTILATIVGEKPAKIPDHIGVFVVDGGSVKSGELV